MSATRTRRPAHDADTTPLPPQTTPSHWPGAGHDFTLQAVMEMQKSLGEMSATLQATKSSLDGLKGKVDDLVSWKNKIIGGVAVLAVVFSLMGWLAGKASAYIDFRPPVATSPTQPPTALPAPPAAPAQTGPSER